jgi:gamma-tubulin complex component 3
METTTTPQQESSSAADGGASYFGRRRQYRQTLIRDMESSLLTAAKSSSLQLQISEEQQQQQQQQSIQDDRKMFRVTYQAAVVQDERAILRECVYALSGISGERLSWKDRQQMTIPVPPPTLPDHYSILGSGSKDMMTMCAYAGILYQSLSNFAEEKTMMMMAGSCSTSTNMNAGSIGRAIGIAVQHELVAYRTIIAKQQQEEKQGENTEQDRRFCCLRELLMETPMQAALGRLRNLAMIMAIPLLSTQTNTSTCPFNKLDLHGSEWITHLFRHLNHGDTRHCNMVQEFLQAATRPWFHMLYGWTMEGSLNDPAQEFFVVQMTPPVNFSNRLDDKVNDHENDHFFLWHECYRLDPSKVPQGVIDSDLVNLVFIVGKGVNYIRKCLQDVNWSLLQKLQEKEKEECSTEPATSTSTNDNESIQTATAGGRALRFPQNPPGSLNMLELGFVYIPHKTDQQSKILRSTLQKSATLVHSHILHSLKNEYALMQHLWALKQFLLLGQGDFVSSLVDGIQAEYGEHPQVYTHNSILGGGIYRHTLRGILESSLRSIHAYAGFSPNVLERLDVDIRSEMDDDKTNPKQRNVWDVFALRYMVPDPIAAIVDARAMEAYERAFSFLFGLRKVEHFLNYTWRQSSILQRALHANAQYLMIQIHSNREYARAIVLLRQVAMTRQSMVHFVVILKSYLMYEVLETSWKRLILAIQNARTLDDVIAAHDKYLRGITRKSLVRREGDFHDNGSLSAKLNDLLSLVESFCLYQQELFQDALEAAERAAEKRREAQILVDQGSWGVQTEKEVREQETCFGLSDTSKLIELDRITRSFNDLVRRFLHALDSKLNGSSAAPEPNFSATARYSENDKSTDLDEEDDDLDLVRSLASQLDFNEFYGVISF